MDQGVSRGYGFVRMADLEAQKKILDKEFHEIDGRRCQVKVPQSKVVELQGHPMFCF